MNERISTIIGMTVIVAALVCVLLIVKQERDKVIQLFNQSYLEGQEAAKFELSTNLNPYASHSELYSQWQRGYADYLRSVEKP